MTRTVRSNRGATGPRAPQEIALRIQGTTTLNDAASAPAAYVSPAGRNFTAAKSRALADVASTGTVVLPITKNGAAAGSVTFSAGVVTGVLALTGGQLQAGDVLRIFGPATPDPTLSGVTIVLGEDL